MLAGSGQTPVPGVGSMGLTESYAIGPSTPPVRDLTLGELLREAARTAPERVALVAGVADPSARRTWTYGELLAEATTAARALRARFAPAERVALWAPNYPEWVILEFAAAMAGMVVVTVNPAFRAPEAEYVLQQSRSAGIVTATEFRGNPMLAAVEEMQPRCPELRDIIRFDRWADFLASAADFQGELSEPAPSDPVMIQYTSGTTGFPKGALLHHRGLANNGAHTADRMGLSDGGVMVGVMPLFHTGGCVCTVLAAVSKRATLVLLESFDPGLALELFAAYHGTAMLGVPTMLVAMMEHPSFPTTDLSAIEAVCSGGSLVPAPMVRRFEDQLDAPFTIVFGQTECSPVASMTQPTDTIEDKAGTIGPPMPGVEVKIVDPVTGDTLPVGAVGEFCTRGYHVMDGYFENPEATALAIDADGWLHTGDLCAMDERGYCTVEGRLKDMIIRGGENIYPRELENLLMAHPAVGEVAVVGLPDERWGETVAAFVRPAAGHKVDKDELFAHVREHLAPHKTPKHWFAVEQFPLTGSGKIQKYKLREQWLSGEWLEL
jgi:acyl-CoA synthetase (AMP-forming)/AMP-acid ligase II